MTSFVFIGIQGAGKGVFLGHVLKPLFGEIQTLQVEDEQLKSSFNGWLKNVCFIAFNEVAHDNRGRNSLNSKIKSIITDPTITVNEKNIRTYQIDNNVNCIFYSNERVPLLVEKSDRRYSIIETGGNLAQFDWFKVPGSFEAYKKELPAFAQYLWNIEVDQKMANSTIDNELKKSLISAGQNRWEEFSHRLKSADEEWFVGNTQDVNGFYPFDRYIETPQYLDLDWDNICDEHSLPKDQALRLFMEIYRDKSVTKHSLTKHLAMYGIRGQRKGAGADRVQFYEWD